MIPLLPNLPPSPADIKANTLCLNVDAEPFVNPHTVKNMPILAEYYDIKLTMALIFLLYINESTIHLSSLKKLI